MICPDCASPDADDTCPHCGWSNTDDLPEDDNWLQDLDDERDYEDNGYCEWP